VNRRKHKRHPDASSLSISEFGIYSTSGSSIQEMLPNRHVEFSVVLFVKKDRLDRPPGHFFGRIVENLPATRVYTDDHRGKLFPGLKTLYRNLKDQVEISHSRLVSRSSCESIRRQATTPIPKARQMKRASVNPRTI
jgi:hypothetical protein